MSAGAPSAAAARAELVERPAAAQRRLDQVQREQRAAGEAREATRSALIEFERQGTGSPHEADAPTLDVGRVVGRAMAFGRVRHDLVGSAAGCPTH